MIRAILSTLFDITLPGACPTCLSGHVERTSPLCPACSEKLKAQQMPPVFSSLGIEAVYSCRPYNGISGSLIREIKYSGKLELLIPFSHILEELFSGYLRDRNADIIVPVPIHISRYISRGFNQAHFAARILAKTASLPVVNSCLAKVRNTPQQTRLSAKERHTNLKGSIKTIRPKLCLGKNIILMDDVITTGATLELCASELMKHGAKSVVGVTLARA